MKMQIKIKIPTETLYLLNRIISRKNLFDELNIVGKCRQSQIIELRDIFLKKGVSVAIKDYSTGITITLRYHLAHTLMELLQIILLFCGFSPYEVVKLDLLKNELHQKLL